MFRECVGYGGDGTYGDRGNSVGNFRHGDLHGTQRPGPEQPRTGVAEAAVVSKGDVARTEFKRRVKFGQMMEKDALEGNYK